MKIIAIAGSNSETSINKKLLTYTTTLFEGENQVEIVDMNEFEMPIYKPEREKQLGIPNEALNFLEKIHNADIVLLALPEYNGNYTTAFKNVFDWASRIPNKTIWNNIPMLLMVASPGARGGIGVLEIAQKRFPYHGGNIVETFSLPSFSDNFDIEAQKIINEEKDNELKTKIKNLCKA